MSRKHYVEMAECLHEILVHHHKQSHQDCVRMVAEVFADMCQEDNENFDRNRFLRACGIEP